MSGEVIYKISKMYVEWHKENPNCRLSKKRRMLLRRRIENKFNMKINDERMAKIIDLESSWLRVNKQKRRMVVRAQKQEETIAAKNEELAKKIQMRN